MLIMGICDRSSIRHVLLWICCWQLICSASENEYVYSFKRDQLMEAERRFENRKGAQSTAEETVNQYLQYLKWREFVRTGGKVKPIEDRLDDISSTELYNILRQLPKGGNMHSHENHDVSRKTLLDIVWNSTDFEHLHILPADHPRSPWILDFFINPPRDDHGWVKVKGHPLYTKEEILKHQTLVDHLSLNASRNPADSGLRWREMSPLWDRSSMLISNIQIKMDYIRAMYEKGLEQGIIYFETRKNLYEEIYVLDPSPEYAGTFGRRYLNESGDEEIEMIEGLIENFTRNHPEFVGHRRISTARRTSTPTKFQFYAENVIRLRHQYPGHVVGFDVIGEEDAGYALGYYLPQMMKLFDISTGHPRVPLYLHSVETNWPDDLMTSSLGNDLPGVSDRDLYPTLMNIYETVLLNATRIGHGLGFIKHPYLLSMLKERQVAMEICIVSNQLLGYTPDVRNHPAQHYFRFGIPIVLGTDDAGTLGYDNFTVDWFEAFMSWGIDLEDLKVIALNSLKFSALSRPEQEVAIERKWRPMWNRFVTETRREACERDFAGEARRENRTVSFARILPTEGAKVGRTKVHVLGRNFEVGICREIRCRFGTLRSPSAASYVSNQHIVCESPDLELNGGQRKVEVFVSFGDDNNDDNQFISTGFSFSYIHDSALALGSTETPSHSTPSHSAAFGLHTTVERLSLIFRIISLTLSTLNLFGYV